MKKEDSAQAPKTIKRYGNRKLYDPAAKRYVTLDDLAGMVGKGQEVHVVDQRTGEDITTVILAQVVLETIRERTASIPRQVLARLIRLGSVSPSTWGRFISPHEAAERSKEEAERIVKGLLARGRLSIDEARALRGDIAESVHRIVASAQASLEGRFGWLLEKGNPEGASRPSLKALKGRLTTLETRLAERRPPRKTAGPQSRQRRKA